MRTARTYSLYALGALTGTCVVATLVTFACFFVLSVVTASNSRPQLHRL